MTTSIRSEATRSVIVVNGVDQVAINSDGSMELLVPNTAPTGNDVVSAVNFNSLLTTNGWQKLPSGLIVQWGVATTPVSGGIAVTFPIAFPNACHSVSAVANATAVQQVSVVAQKSNTTITLYAGNSASGAGVAIGLFWMAIGY